MFQRFFAAFLRLFRKTPRREFQGREVFDLEFHLADGRLVRLPMTEAGALPAENAAVKVEVAGVVFGPSGPDPSIKELGWRFGFTVKQLGQLEWVEVSDLSPGQVARVLVSDTVPALLDNYWMGATGVSRVSPESTPWLYAYGTSIHVFSFKIKARGKAPFVLDQAACFSEEAKMYILHVASHE